MAGDVLYASRPTREDADEVAREQYDLAAKFGLPVTVERRISPIRPPETLSS
jgi:hypothetical protein